jgi:hypothetical protein
MRRDRGRRVDDAREARLRRGDDLLSTGHVEQDVLVLVLVLFLLLLQGLYLLLSRLVGLLLVAPRDLSLPVLVRYRLDGTFPSILILQHTGCRLVAG